MKLPRGILANTRADHLPLSVEGVTTDHPAALSPNDIIKRYPGQNTRGLPSSPPFRAMLRVSREVTLLPEAAIVDPAVRPYKAVVRHLGTGALIGGWTCIHRPMRTFEVCTAGNEPACCEMPAPATARRRRSRRRQSGSAMTAPISTRTVAAAATTVLTLRRKERTCCTRER